MFMFSKDKTKEEKLATAKLVVAGAIRLALNNNPQYRAGLAAFCAVVTGDLSQTLSDAVAKELDCQDDQDAMAILRLALDAGGFKGFDEIDQLAILKEICGLAS